MPGLDRETPLPTALTVHQASRVLEIAFSDGAQFRIPFELMRVYSPSAEVQGHGPGQEVLVLDKQDVRVTGVEPIGNYAVRLLFDDGHDTGLYTFAYLHELGAQQDAKTQAYRARVEAAIKRKAGH